MNKETYQINFPIGDWSADGHGNCKHFRILSDKPVQDIREAHFKCPEITGTEIGDLCSRYGEYRLTEDQVSKLTTAGLPLEDICELNEEGRIAPNPEELLKIWIWLLNHIDPGLNLRQENPVCEDIVFFGHDEQSRHLRSPGYGVF